MNSSTSLKTIFVAIKNTKRESNDERVKIFCDAALDTLKKNAGIGENEGTFNGLKFIHNKFRNRLGKTKLKKLLYIWWNDRKLHKCTDIDSLDLE